MKIDIDDDGYKLITQTISPLEELGDVLDEVHAIVTLLAVARDIRQHMGSLRSPLTPMGLYGVEWEHLAAVMTDRLRRLLGEEPGEEPRGLALDIRRATQVHRPPVPPSQAEDAAS